MKNLFAPLFFIVVGLAVSCGASDKKADQDNENYAHAANALTSPAADTIKVGHVDKTEEEWKELLTDDEYYILRERGTEPAFSSDLLDIKTPGVFYCAACGLPLFTTSAKFESGTGWPSFTHPIAPNVVNEVKDTRLGMVRTEIVCAQCGSHIGHVFNDGPEPMGVRYCMNGLSLNFKAK